VIGTGQMGPGIAATLALGGAAVSIVSRRPESAAKGLDTAREGLATLARHGLVDPARAATAGERLSATADFDGAIAPADLVVESAPENMQFKQELFARLDAIARPGCVLATNTSGLSITEIQSRCRCPERAVTAHFWNPPHLMPLVEIVRGARTDAGIAEQLRDYLTACGKVPVIVHKDRPGQLGNRLQHALVREALYIVQEGIASVADVDLAVKNGFGLRLPVYGVFEHLDAVGFDIAAAVADYVSRDLSNHAGVMPLMREKMRRGEPFCDWSQKSMDQVKARRNAFLLDFLARWGKAQE
jgi:3-hydroxybutyryl-CoA dehydrogenase